MECGQSIQSLKTLDQATYMKYYRVTKISTELEKSRYLSQVFIDSMNVVLFDNEQDDVITLPQREKEESNYKKNHRKLPAIL